MNITERVVNGVLVIELQAQRLDAAEAESFKGIIVDRVNRGARKLVLDFSQVEFMDSSGLAAVLSSIKSLSQSGGAIAVCNVGGAVQNLFRLTKLDKVIKVYASDDEACSELA